jgi:hypothetical protein
VDELKSNIFYFIKNLEEPSINASSFHINNLSSLQDISESLAYISKSGYKHVNNNHKKLKFSQIKELKDLDDHLEILFANIESAFHTHSFEKIGHIIKQKHKSFTLVQEKIQKQVELTRAEESSPKNTTLYFSLLIETKDLLKSTMTLLEDYYVAHDSSVEPATISTTETPEDSSLS